eukprot:1160222-Pelagomonas_calceolata.AAC.5
MVKSVMSSSDDVHHAFQICHRRHALCKQCSPSYIKMAARQFRLWHARWADVSTMKPIYHDVST